MIVIVGLISCFLVGYFSWLKPPEKVSTHFFEAFNMAVCGWCWGPWYSYLFYVVALQAFVNAICLKKTGLYIGPYLRSIRAT